MPTYLHRKSEDRGRADHGWLKATHSFSFGNYYDPKIMGFRALRVINEDRIAGGGGFPTHPHDNMEIVTYILHGALEHRDSIGSGAVIRPGEAQRMSAGTGVVHSEINQGDKPCRLLQIWIVPSSTGIAPAYEQKPFAIGPGWTPLLDPEQADGAMAIHRPVRLWRAQPGAGETLSLALGTGRQGWIQLIDGAGEANGHPLQQGDGLGYGAGKLEAFTAGSGGADLLLFELC